MKINYKGQELETITEGYWPDGITLVAVDICAHQEYKDVVCLHNSNAFFANGTSSGLNWPHWAILPSKPAPRRLTNREVYGLWRKGWDLKDYNGFVCYPGYSDKFEKETIDAGYKLRAPNTDEWLEPTTDLLEK